MPAQKLKEFLDANEVKYVVIQHSPAYTAQEIAASAHVPGKDLAKTVIVKLDGNLTMAVLSASQKVDLDCLQDATGAKRVELAGESDFKDVFPGCTLGAMPPFGNLYDVEVYVSIGLTKDDRIAFNAGTHTELIQLAYKDFERLVQPKIVRLSLTD